MGYAALLLASIGLAVGTRSRITALLPILVLLLPVSILFSVLRGFSVLDTAVAVILAQTIVQSSYLLGVVARAALSDLDSAPQPKKHEPDRRRTRT